VRERLVSLPRPKASCRNHTKKQHLARYELLILIGFHDYFIG